MLCLLHSASQHRTLISILGHFYLLELKNSVSGNFKSKIKNLLLIPQNVLIHLVKMSNLGRYRVRLSEKKRKQRLCSFV